jgi:acyl carrier protein phosphodiesterase
MSHNGSFQTNNCNANPYIFVTVDTPIYDKQLELIAAELNDFGAKAKNRWDKLMFKHWESVGHDGYGSFILYFDEEVLTLADTTKQRVIDSAREFVYTSNWMCSLSCVTSIQDSLDEYSIEEVKENEFVARYIESLIDCGYNVSKEELLDVFSNVCTEEDIEKEMTALFFNRPEYFLKSNNR